MQVISQNPQMTQGPPIMQQVVVVRSPTSNVQQNYRHKHALGLGITQIVLGTLCIIFQGVAIGVWAAGAYISAGIWSGVLFVLAGSFGIVSAKQKTKPWIVLTMVMSIISAAFTSSIIIVSSLGIAADEDCNSYYYWCYGSRSEKLAMNSVLLVLGVGELVVSILASVLCCHVCCCGKSTTDTSILANPGTQGTAQYMQPIQGQPTFMMNPGQPNITYTVPQGYNQQSLQAVMVMPSQQMGANVTTDRPPGYTTLAPVHGNQPNMGADTANNQVAPHTPQGIDPKL